MANTQDTPIPPEGISRAAVSSDPFSQVLQFAHMIQARQIDTSVGVDDEGYAHMTVTRKDDGACLCHVAKKPDGGFALMSEFMESREADTLDELLAW